MGRYTICVVVLVAVSLQISAQQEPTDTLIYEKFTRISYLHDSYVSGHPVDCYYSNENLTKALFDTVYYEVGKPAVTRTRLYLNDNSVLHYKYGKVDHKIKIKLPPQGYGLIYQPFQKDTFYIQVWLHSDSSISSIMVGLAGKKVYDNKETLVNMRFEQGTKISEKSVLNLGDDYGKIQLVFYNGYLLKSISHERVIDNNWRSKIFKFYENGMVKETGLLGTSGNVGNWYNYSLGGQLKSLKDVDK